MIKKLNEAKRKLNINLFVLLSVETIGVIVSTIVMIFLNQLIYVGIAFLVITNFIFIYLTYKNIKGHKKIRAEYLKYRSGILENIHFVTSSESDVKINRKEFIKLNIIPSFSSISVDNKISGTYENTNYILYDAVATVQTGQSASIVFSGRIYELDLPNHYLHTILTENKYFRIKNMEKRKIAETKITEYSESNTKHQFSDESIITLFKVIKRHDKSRLSVKITRNRVMVSVSRIPKLFEYKYFNKLTEINYTLVEEILSEELENIISSLKDFLEINND